MKTTKKTGFFVALSLLVIQTSQAQTLKDALKFTENHQFDVATAAYHKLIAEKPTDGSLYYYMGENMYKSERFDSAAFYYEKGISVDPAVGLNYVGKGKIALTKNDEATAKPLFEKALVQHTQDSKAYIAIAEAYVDNEWKNMTYALECLAKAEKMDRSNINIYMLMGDAALISTNDGIVALNNYEKARDLEPKNPRPLIQMGNLYERARSYDLSFVEYKKAISLDVNFAPAYLKLGDLWYQYKNYDSAIVNLEIYVKLSNSLSARVKYAKYLFLAKQYQRSVDEIEKIEKIDKSFNILNRIKAYDLFELKKCPEALISIELFLKNAPTSGDKLISEDDRYYGKILACNGKDSLAIPYLKSANAKDSSKLDVYRELYNAYIKTKQFNEAISILQKKFTLVKEPSVNDIYSIGLAFYQKAAFVKDSTINLKADSCFKIVTERQPDYVNGFMYRARANATLDPQSTMGLAKPHYEAAIAVAIADVEKNKKSLLEAYYYLGYYYTLQADKVKALEYVDKILQIDPENKEGLQLKKYIDAKLK